MAPNINVTIKRNKNDAQGPHDIFCLNSDGSSFKRPLSESFLDARGRNCGWRLAQHATLSRSKWLATLGRKLADACGLTSGCLHEVWRLKDFPRGYQFYTYNQGDRQDHYLFGSTKDHKFPTANAFFPHLLWLSKGDPKADCQCMCCCKQASDIRKSRFHMRPLSNRSKAVSSLEGSTGQLSRNSRKALSSTKSAFRGPYLNPDITRDLIDRRSNFRKHELVWCQVKDLKIGKGDLEIGINYWPGLCEDAVLCSQSQAVYVLDDASALDEPVSCQAKPESQKATAGLKRKSNRPKPNPLSRRKLETCQKYQWKVRLLALSDVILREESHILPWLFKPGDMKEKFAMKYYNHSQLPPHLHAQKPSGRPSLDSFEFPEDATISFQLALQIAGNLEQFWEATDRYDLHAEADDSSLPSRSPSQALHTPCETPHEVWFQAVWWGAEKVWLYDLVRLNKLEIEMPPNSLERYDITLNETTAAWEDGRHLPGTIEKSYFLKIDGIYRDEKSRKLVMMGRIFDLVKDSSESKCQSSTNTEENYNQSRAIDQYMPDPPPGYAFRQITPPDQKFHHVFVECVAGRYYSTGSTSQSHRLAEIRTRIAAKLFAEIPSTARSKSSLSGNSESLIWMNASLFGYTSGQRNFMRCRKWKSDRSEGIMEAEALAEKEMILAFERTAPLHKNKSRVNGTTGKQPIIEIDP